MDGKEKQFKTIDEYIEASPKDVQGILQRLRLTIRKAPPEAAKKILRLRSPRSAAIHDRDAASSREAQTRLMPPGRHIVDRRQRVAYMFDITQVVVIVAGFALVATLVFFLKGLYLIRAGEVGVLVKRLGGRKMPAGQVIARHGEIGTQAATLMPGLYWRMPVVWSMRRSKVVQVAETEIATVEAIDGRPLPKGRLLGDEVECNQFQDGEAFLDNGGVKGPAEATLRPGALRINTLPVFRARPTATGVASANVGVVESPDCE